MRKLPSSDMKYQTSVESSEDVIGDATMGWFFHQQQRTSKNFSLLHSTTRCKSFSCGAGAYIIYRIFQGIRYQAGLFISFIFIITSFFTQFKLSYIVSNVPMYACFAIHRNKISQVFPPNYILNVHGSSILAYQQLSNTVLLIFEKKQFSNI